MTPSTGPPALTMMMILRGRSRAATNSSLDSVPVKSASSPYSSMKWRVFSGLRLWTATDQPLRPIFRARFAPITARPVTPIWLFSLMDLTLSMRGCGRGLG